MIRTAAVIPVLNEEGAIGPTVAQLPRNVIDPVFVVDGGSRDNTVAEARAAGATVIEESRRGYGQACATGTAAARAAGAEIVVFLDGDGADAGEEAAALINPVLAGDADFVLATRTRGRREPGSMGPHQVFAGLAVGRILRWTTGVAYTDMCAFRAIRIDTLDRLGMTEKTYGWNLEMQVRAARAGLRVREVALPYRRRIAGHSKVAGNLRGTLRAGTRIAVTLVRILRATA